MISFNSKFIILALEEAKKAFVVGEVPVGAVIVNRNTSDILALGHNLVESRQNPLMHAEIVVINEACNYLGSKYLTECDIYVSLEPCTMCAAAIAHARIARLFYSASDLKQGAVENGSRFFTNSTCIHKPEIYIGLHEEFSSSLIQSFFRKLRKSNV